MLRITDARTGASVDATPARRGLTRVEAHVSGFDTGALRVLLVTDLLVRALELGGTPVWAVLRTGHEQPELRAGAAALGIRPLEDGREVGRSLGEKQVIHVVAADAGPEADQGPEGVRLAVAPVHAASPAPLAGADPVALRLALLTPRRDRPVRLDTEALTEAHDTLARWRHAVAGWARHPSRPIPDHVRTELRAAWEDDLDVPGVLRLLARVAEEPELPDGARFETYAYADRLLGLDLVRDLGHPL
ncbi:hypothetical protein [Streptomyces sp. NPDC048002]|uniref:hypothetical protein n=1 Tax=Streptomyces sp. NPDC048002 TaxID=3154344 RepID=UPI0033F9724E